MKNCHHGGSCNNGTKQAAQPSSPEAAEAPAITEIGVVKDDGYEWLEGYKATVSGGTGELIHRHDGKMAIILNEKKS